MLVARLSQALMQHEGVSGEAATWTLEATPHTFQAPGMPCTQPCGIGGGAPLHCKSRPP